MEQTSFIEMEHKHVKEKTTSQEATLKTTKVTKGIKRPQMTYLVDRSDNLLDAWNQ